MSIFKIVPIPRMADEIAEHAHSQLESYNYRLGGEPLLLDEMEELFSAIQSNTIDLIYGRTKL